VKWTKFVIPY